MTNTEDAFLILRLSLAFAGNQVIAQDVLKDDEQSQCSKMKPGNIKVFSRTLLCSAILNKIQILVITSSAVYFGRCFHN